MTERRFAVDTSALMSVDGCRNPSAAWAGLLALIGSGRLFTVRYVYDELKRNDQSTYDRLRPHYATIVVPDTELWSIAGDLALRYPAMSKWYASRDRADTWVIALARVRALTVVCEEKNVGRVKERSMSYVCEQEEIPCVTLARLMDEEGWA